MAQARTATPPPPVPGARWLPLSRGKFSLVDEDVFEELMRRPWTYSGKSNSARHGRQDGTPKELHRYIMRASSEFEVDHRNGDRLDNRRANLRLCTNIDQTRNAKKKRRAGGTTSRFKGVYLARQQRGTKRWYAMIRVYGRRRWLGGFVTEEEAALAYDAAAREAFGEFACVNFPREGERSAV